MKTHVEFRSDAFPAYPGEEDETNPDCYGKRLAEYVSVALRQHGYETTVPIAEDWGWVVSIKNESFPLWVGCGIYAEDEDGFLCFIEPHKPFIRRWFKKIDTRARVRALQVALDKILSAHSQVRQIRWWTHEEFNHPTST
ncbi:MAG: hypothetical protein HOP19_12435 [Acidobacteria bacterium]|nr:hypothetical protein [Acidobacteriota bacterium]